MRTALVTLVRLVWGVILGLSMIAPRLVVALAFLVMTLDLVCSLVALGLVAVALGLAAVALSLACLATIALGLAVDDALRLTIVALRAVVALRLRLSLAVVALRLSLSLTAIALSMATTNHFRCCPPINNARVDESLQALLL